jgi:hypothetical protein
MLEVLEHMHEPLAALRQAYRLLQPGGWLLVTVPNIASLEYRLWGRHWVGLEPPLHLAHFSPATLAAALEKTGFMLAEVAQSVSTAGLTRSLWLTLRRRGDPAEAPAAAHVYHSRSWRRSAHRALSLALWPLGAALSRLHLGPGLIALARRPE